MQNKEDFPQTSTPIGVQTLVIPAFRGSPQVMLEMSRTKEAEARLIESKNVNPVTFPDLTSCFNESYRELRKNMSNIGHLIAKTEKAIEDIKADILLDRYPAFMEGKPKTSDNADLRKAFISRDPAFSEALDRLNMLKAIESFIDGRIKIMERTVSFMNKQMDIVIRSGLSNQNLYVTSGKK